MVAIVLLAVPVTGASQMQVMASDGYGLGKTSESSRPKAPIAISGDNQYIAWWTDKTGNNEVIFRASNDNGATFGDKINLSNKSEAESQDVEIAAEGDIVMVTWWENNQTAKEPVLRISTDAGETFGPLLWLANNGTIGQISDEE